MERRPSWWWRRRRSRRWRGRPVDGADGDRVDGAVGGIRVEVTVGVEEAGGCWSPSAEWCSSQWLVTTTTDALTSTPDATCTYTAVSAISE